MGLLTSSRIASPRGALRRVLADEAGQGMTEWVVLVVSCTIPLVPFSSALINALASFYDFSVSWVSLPFP